MAIELTYGQVETPVDVSGIFDEVNEKYAPALKSLLPTGPIWNFEQDSDAYALLRALSYSLSRIEIRGQDLLREFDPTTMRELLPDWERVFGLPGDNPSPPSTLAARRVAVHSRFLGYGDPNIGFFEDLASALGYPNAYVNQHFLSSFVPGSVAGDPCATKWQYVWEMVTARGADDALLQWSLENVAPEHCKLIMFWLLNLEQRLFDSPGGNTFYDVAYNGSDLWCAVGTNGSIQTSSDGITWTARASDGAFSGNFFSVAYDTVNSLWCIGGSSGELQTSPDGVNWTARTAAGGFGGIFYGIEHDQTGLWVAVGTSGTIQTSPDGTTWTARTAAGGYTASWYGVAYGGGTWVVVGGDTSSPYYGKINTSTDGITWVDVAPAGNPTGFYEVRHNGTNQFMLVGTDSQIQTSADGSSWRRRAPPDDTPAATDFFDVVYAGNRWIIIGQNGELIESWYGEDWKRQALTKTDLYGIGYGGGTCCLVGGTAGDQIYTAEA